ncbi:MAG: MFS transporter [Kineosporiaceae bacterium]
MTTRTDTGAAPRLLSPRYRVDTISIITVVTLIAFEALAVATAMPVAASALHGVRSYGLAFASFFATQLLGVVAAGGWTDASGPRGPVLGGLGLFAAGLLVAGTAPTFPVLLLGRALTGLGGGLLVVSLYVVVAQVYPQDLQPRVFGAISTAWVLPSIVGPAIAGWLATHWSWRAVFLVVLPLAVLLVPVLAQQLRSRAPDDPPTTAATGARGRLLRGIGLAAGALALQAGIDTGVPTGIAPAVAGALLVCTALPGLVPPGTLRLRRGLPALVAVRGFFTGSFAGAEAFVPLMLVEHRGITPALAGAALTCGSLGWTGGSWLQGTTWFRIERTAMLTLGAIVLGVGVLLLAVTPLGAVPVLLVPAAWIVAAAGMGLGMSSMSVLTLRLSPPGEEGRSSSGLQVGDALGSLLGIALAGTLFSALHTPRFPDAGTYSVVWLVMGAVGLLAAAASQRVAP